MKDPPPYYGEKLQAIMRLSVDSPAPASKKVLDYSWNLYCSSAFNNFSERTKSISSTSTGKTWDVVLYLQIWGWFFVLTQMKLSFEWVVGHFNPPLN